MLIIWLFYLIWFLVICIFDPLIYSKFKSIILFFLLKIKIIYIYAAWVEKIITKSFKLVWFIFLKRAIENNF